MRTTLVAAAIAGAALCALLAGWLLAGPGAAERGPAPAPSAEVPPEAGTTGPPAPAGTPPAPPSKPVPAAPVPAPVPPPEPLAPGDVPIRPVGPQPEGGAGEILRADLPKADAEKVDATRKRLVGTEVGAVDWKQKGLRAALEGIAEQSGVPVEIEGKGLDDEPVMLHSPGGNAFERVREIAMQRNLRFEITADRVIVRR